ncbi:MAG: hypothetical protein RL277_2091 [Planctomycetota bacterium]|jgi:hypothetical protein
MKFPLRVLLFLSLLLPLRAEWRDALDRAGSNRAELEAAVAGLPEEQRPAMRWLIERMPLEDAQSLKAEFLIAHCKGAFEAWHAAPWRETVPEDVFLDAILPYACVNERRDAWRQDFRARFWPLVKDATSAGAAAAKLNQQIFALNKVSYSTKRKKADQSPYETLESGLASCTGLSILLIDACRAVGVPARFVGTPLWSDKSGNHSWVEIWDNGWHFTGAAEATGDALDQGWFVDRAAGARTGDPQHAIFATTWKDSPLTFPMVWAPKNTSVRALDVTERYLRKASAVPAGMARVRFRVKAGDTRVAALVKVVNPLGVTIFDGRSKDERFDGNDHLTANLPLNGRYQVQVIGGSSLPLMVERDEQLVDLKVGALGALEGLLSSGGLEAVLRSPLATEPLNKAEARQAWSQLVQHRAAQLAEQRKAELDARRLEVAGASMPFWYTSFGSAKPGSRSLWISMHGGGGAPAAVNDQQWENQKQLYKLEEGIYVAPRAPSDTWNLWHQGHIDPLFERLIENMIAIEGVDPDRVYIIGYSAGGDGVYQLAPRMADQLAAAGMMAGHPNETQPDGLRNIGFALHMGANDAAYNRNQIAAQWKERLGKLAMEDKGGYAHQVVIHEGKGHWMDRQDREALPWMAKFTRDTNPAKIIWLQDDVVHNRFYWLSVSEPRPGTRIVATREGQKFRIEGAKEAGLVRLRLNDALADLDRPVVIERDGVKVHEGKVTRTLAAMAGALLERFDPAAVCVAEVSTQAQ